MPPRVTIRTIAKELGVHASTVSRALRPDQSGEVSDEVSANIRALAAKLGYEPDPWARSLRTRETRTIGLLIPRLTDSVLAAMFEAAEDRARDHGYQAVTVSTRDRHHEERRLTEVLLERRVDGLILATPTLDDPLLPDLERDDVRFVLLNRASASYPSVRGDDESGGYLAARHLLSQGHRRIAIIAGPLEASTARYRLSGFERAHREMQAPIDPALVLPSMFSPRDGVDGASHLLSLEPRPTAIFAVNDAVAFGVMAVARDLGVRIPEDLAVVGYNDTDLAPLVAVPLTSVAVPTLEMGRLAVDALVARLTSRVDVPINGTVLPPRLVVRQSSAFPHPKRS